MFFRRSSSNDSVDELNGRRHKRHPPPPPVPPPPITTHNKGAIFDGGDESNSVLSGSSPRTVHPCNTLRGASTHIPPLTLSSAPVSTLNTSSSYGSLWPGTGENQPSTSLGSISTISLKPPASPGTPQKKSWEKKIGSFLTSGKHKGSSHGIASIPSLPLVLSRSKSGNKSSNSHGTLKSLMTRGETVVASSQNSRHSSNNSTDNDGSVRGGKFFAHVFRSDSNKDSSGGGRLRTKSAVDDLDGTIRKGEEKTYSPANSRFIVSSSVPHGMNSSNLAAGTSFHQLSGTGMPNPPTFLKPLKPQPLVNSDVAAKSSINEPTDSAMKKVFTDIHNSSNGTNSAYLGDEPSLKGKNLFWAQRNQHVKTASVQYSSSHGNFSQLLADAGDVSETKMLSSSISDTFTYNRLKAASSTATTMPVPPASLHHTTTDAVASSPDCVLRPILGTESWEDGRRYLIAPAAMATCPSSTVTSLLRSSCRTMLTAKEASERKHLDALSPFLTIYLGTCLLSQGNSPSQQEPPEPKKWTPVKLVLRQNYLLEYAMDADVESDVPRGYAHLEHSSTLINSHFDDSLELKYYRSPCAKTDTRTLLVRIEVDDNDDNALDSSTMENSDTRTPSCSSSERSLQRKRSRDHWRTCFDHAASLTNVSDLYDFDEDNEAEVLGTSEYVTVRSGRRRTHGMTQSVHQSDCALKIFHKKRFWKSVVSGRERCDTMVREISVQSTLSAKCGIDTFPSFLRLLGVFETSDHLVLELELLEGIDLFQYVSSKGTLNEIEVALITRDIVRCLHVMGRLNMAHRDVKLSNILMCGSREDQTDLTSCRVKLGDFGMAAFVGVDGYVRGRCGTPGYVAPEIFTANPLQGYENKVDMFSAGVTLYLMLCGYEPFFGKSDNELKQANKRAYIDYPDEEWSHISHDARDLVARMLCKDPKMRICTGEALHHPWLKEMLKHDEKLDSGFASSSDEIRNNDDACCIS